MFEDRYSRQVLFSNIGSDGQELIQEGSVLIIGCGAIGTVLANNLVRAGVGKIKIVDRDFVEPDNLQCQILFDEEDARQLLPKAVASAQKLRKINSEISIESEVVDVTPRNIEALIASVDLVLDATDNMETRLLINDACVKNRIPWIYAGAAGSCGMTMNIIPTKSACLRCFIDRLPPLGSMPSCDTVGLLNGVPSVIASFQSAETLKFLTRHSEPENRLLYIDLWQRRFSLIHVKRRTDCPACMQQRFDFLDGSLFPAFFSLCGRNAVQISPVKDGKVDLERLKENLTPIGEVSYNGFFLSAKIQQYQLIIFPEGRTMIKGTTDESIARSLCAKYIGA